MTFQAQRPEGALLRIDGYAGRGFRIGERAFGTGVLVAGAEAWPLVGLDIAALAPVFDAQPAVELLLIGMGATAEPVEPGLAAALRARGIAAEAMDSRAAARTFNVLVLEGRRVAAALLAV